MNTGISFADLKSDIEEGAKFITSISEVMQSYQETFQFAGLNEDDTNLMMAAVPYLASISLTLRNAFLAGNENIVREWAVSPEFEKIIMDYVWGKVKHLRPELDDEEGIALIEELSAKYRSACEKTKKKKVKETPKKASDGGKVEHGVRPKAETNMLSGFPTVEVIGPSAFLPLPSSPASNGLFNLLGLRGDDDLKRLAQREKKIGHGKTIQVLGSNEYPKLRRIETKTKAAELTYTVENVEFLRDAKGTMKKLYTFILSGMGAAFHDGEMVKDSISFPLEELIELGIYTDLDAAREGFKVARRNLTGIHVEGTMKRGKRTISQGGGPLFTWGEVEQGRCIITLNPKIQWGLYSTYYVPLPRYMFGLPLNPFTLGRLIFTTARQRHKEIAENGVFDMGLRTVQTRLNLPDEDKTGHPRRDIQDVIEDAVSQIEEASNTKDLSLLFIGENNLPMIDSYRSSISNFLAGKLRVGFSGDYATFFKALDESNVKKVEVARKRKEKLTKANSQ